MMPFHSISHRTRAVLDLIHAVLIRLVFSSRIVERRIRDASLESERSPLLNGGERTPSSFGQYGAVRCESPTRMTLENGR